MSAKSIEPRLTPSGWKRARDTDGAAKKVVCEVARGENALSGLRMYKFEVSDMGGRIASLRAATRRKASKP